MFNGSWPLKKIGFLHYSFRNDLPAWMIASLISALLFHCILAFTVFTQKSVITDPR
jgi:hypothetical protein